MNSGLNNRLLYWRGLLCLLAVLVAGAMMLTACERGAHPTIENRMPTDIIIGHEAIRGGIHYERENLGTVLAGQTVQLRKILVLRRDIIGEVVLLKAIDPSGKVVWQKTWSFKEFLKLEQVGWKIIVEP